MLLIVILSHHGGRGTSLIKEDKQYVGNEIRGYVKAYIIASVCMYVWEGRGDR